MFVYFCLFVLWNKIEGKVYVQTEYETWTVNFDKAKKKKKLNRSIFMPMSVSYLYVGEYFLYYTSRNTYMCFTFFFFISLLKVATKIANRKKIWFFFFSFTLYLFSQSLSICFLTLLKFITECQLLLGFILFYFFFFV